MQNLNILETLRTKEELLNYFDEMGQNLTEEEIEKLKKSYAKDENPAGTLTLEQLNDVAGGVINPAHRTIVLEKVTNLLRRKASLGLDSNKAEVPEHQMRTLLTDERVPGDNELEKAYFLVATRNCSIEDERAYLEFILERDKSPEIEKIRATDFGPMLDAAAKIPERVREDLVGVSLDIPDINVEQIRMLAQIYSILDKNK